MSERFADGIVGRGELLGAANSAWPTVRQLPRNAPRYRASWAAAWSTAPANQYFAENASAYLLDATGGILNYLFGALGMMPAQSERQSQLELLHDIFGNSFRPVSMNASWLTPTVVSLAQTIYDERAFDRLPILADALEESGCTDDDILSHCRAPGPHVRGCWVVDLVLGKE